MTLRELLKKRLVFVSGKGGVGKSTLTTTLGLLAAKQKKRVLLIEMNSSGRIPPLFSKKSAVHKNIELRSRLTTINIDPKKCFEEYVLQRIRFKALYKTFFNNNLVTNFLHAVPGLHDILLLGKIYELEQLDNEYDFIVVDAPATGHGLSALEVPKVLQEAVKIGPLKNHADDILSLLANHEKTAFCLITLAEEMPVTESFEYMQALKERTELQFGPLFINAVVPPLEPIKKPSNLDPELAPFWQFYQLTQDRSSLNHGYLKTIDDLFSDFDKITLPFQFKDLKKAADLNSLVDVLKGAYQ